MCAHLSNSIVFVCVRLFELDPALLNLFHYGTNCDSTQDRLASPEFLEHVTKVSSVHRINHHKYTDTLKFRLWTVAMALCFSCGRGLR